MSQKTVYLATRGSALALTQTRMVLEECRRFFPGYQLAEKVITTTGDKLQTASLASANLPKGLFTKELERALLDGEAELAVHSLKDLPTELPEGLILGAVSKRADVRDVLIYRGDRSQKVIATIMDLPRGVTIATSSTRRSAQLLEKRPDLSIVPIRGNVGTRLNKLAQQADVFAIVLAAAGLERLGFIVKEGGLEGESVPKGLRATPLDPSEMLPCVGQAALGIEIKADSEVARQICEKLNDPVTMCCVLAERAFLRAMGGGCQIPVGAYARVESGKLKMSVVSFLSDRPRRAEGTGALTEPEQLGRTLAAQVSA